MDSGGLVTTTRAYEPDTGRLHTLTQHTATKTLYSVTYHYNNDQRDQADVTYATPDGQTHQVYWSYEYDADNADQLQSAQAYSDPARATPITDRLFTYDLNGNRTDVSYALNAANQYTNHPDAENDAITYNARGDLE